MAWFSTLDYITTGNYVLGTDVAGQPTGVFNTIVDKVHQNTLELDLLKLDKTGGTISSNLTVQGNLTVEGDTISNGQSVIADNVQIINNGETGAGVSLGTAGFEVDRGTLVNSTLLWTESGTPRWQYGTLGNLLDIGSKLSSVSGSGNGTAVAFLYADGSTVNWNASHTHAISEVVNLQTSLDNKLGITAKASDSELLDGHDSSYFNSTIGTNTNMTVQGAVVVDTMTLNQGVIQSYTTRTLTLGQLGFTGDSNANYYEHPSTSGYRHIPSGGSVGQILTNDADGSVIWSNESPGVTSHNLLSDKNLGVQHNISAVDGLQTDLDSKLSTEYLATRGISDANLADTKGILINYLESSALNKPPTGTDFSLTTLSHSADWSTQLAGDWREKELWFRTQENSVWKTWAKIWHSDNFDPDSKLNLSGGALTGELELYRPTNGEFLVTRNTSNSNRINHNLYTDGLNNAVLNMYNSNETNIVKLYSGGSSFFLNHLGVGTTLPACRIHTHSDTVQTRIKITNQSSTAVSGGGLDLIVYGLNTYVANREAGNLILRTNDLDRMTIDSTGKIGIGVTSPNKKLEVNGPFDSQFRISRDIDATQFCQISGGASEMKFSSNSNSHTKFTWYSGISESYTHRMTLDAAGKLLIGTASGITGGKELQVNGAINCTDGFFINGVAFEGGGVSAEALDAINGEVI